VLCAQDPVSGWHHATAAPAAGTIVAMNDINDNELFLDAVDAVVLEALVAIGSDPRARLAFFRRLLAWRRRRVRRRGLIPANAFRPPPSLLPIAERAPATNAFEANGPSGAVLLSGTSAAISNCEVVHGPGVCLSRRGIWSCRP